MVSEAWDAVRRSLVYFRSQPVGTIASLDNFKENLNYNKVFVRDFVPSVLTFLMNGEPKIVKNFILKTLRLQSWEKKIDRFQLGGVMPAGFKVLRDPVKNNETLIADFGESAIGRVAPVDFGFWWIILLRAYTKSTGDTSLAELPKCQKGMRLILVLCLSEGFDTIPTLLCADGCCMIDRKMSTNEIWDYLKNEYEGDERIRVMQLLNFVRDFKLQKMKETETVNEYTERLLSITNRVRLLGSSLADSRIMEKILVTLPENFETTVTTLENTKDLSKIPLAELLSALQTQEQRRAMRQ
ncbi:putative alkaline/neutral invertase B [Hibiscus syriacus]|uniref:Alkaline/neutral invertase n=1 Tax=Hibiscus syriacus TaxID=106335 RepID=A0A6A3BT37_HIBSY|nr:putative alkaline/neutral invertase B [Hibiscus syriacus]